MAVGSATMHAHAPDGEHAPQLPWCNPNSNPGKFDLAPGNVDFFNEFCGRGDAGAGDPGPGTVRAWSVRAPCVFVFPCVVR